METYLYLSLIPEALIFSQLPPDRFGMYMANGTKRQSEGPAVFFAVRQGADLSAFRIEEGRKRCQPHPDGSPRMSVYVAIHNVLAQVPLSALGNAYLTTSAGFTLELERAEWQEKSRDSFFLYQELGPVYPRVVSRLEPWAFCRSVTSPDALVSVPRLAFIDLRLGGLAEDPNAIGGEPLPYRKLEHLKDCLQYIHHHPDHHNKIVNREPSPEVPFYMIRSGLFVGDVDGMHYYPLPPEDTLRRDYYLWWNSARVSRGY